MNSKERRDHIKNLLIKSSIPEKGSILAQSLGVTRQIIVKDIAILRAEGVKIIATPEGYLVPSENKNGIKKVLAVYHDKNQMYDELETIVKNGGIIHDVIVEHPVYGEIKGMLMIKNLYDLESFIKKFNDYSAEPLSKLTKGVHIHTIEAENQDIMDRIIRELKNKKYLVCD